MTENAQPEPEDFKSFRELFPNRKFRIPECEVCGLSVYRDLEDAKRACSIVPGMRNKYIALGKLDVHYGHIQHTPKNNQYGASHHTWWAPDGKPVWSAFEMISEPQE